MKVGTKSLLNSSIYFILISFLGILNLILLRIVEFLIINYYHIHEISLKNLFKNSINLDIHFGVTFSAILIIPTVLIASKFPRFSFRFYKFIWFLIIFLSITCTHFFISSEYLITNIIFDFTWEEIKHIIFIEGGTQNTLIWTLYFILPISIICFKKIKQKETYLKWIKYIVIAIYTLLTLIVLINHKHYYKSSLKFDNQYDFFIGNNKLTHFLISIKNSFDQEERFNMKEVNKAIKLYQKENAHNTYSSSKFPLLRSDSIKNVLGAYFKKSKQAPNIVIVVAEGLGSSIAGLHKTSEHVLPYIDTLAEQGLYWDNFLSNCHRTFGVFPNVIGSLTPGTTDRGFINYNGEEKIGKRYPSHNSLIKELKNNHYFTSFFYGGWGDFDSYSAFLKDQEIDLFIDQSQFDSLKYKAPWKRKPSGFYWGYDDRALFNQWFDYTKKHKIHQPYLSIYLTLNMHEPYNIAASKYYNPNFIKNRINKLKLKHDYFIKKDNYTLGSLFYFEDALRTFISSYKKREDFKNTIFIIFGDHYSLISYLNNPLGVYHVPMLIYSPLLKKKAVFKGVSTHLDITPSLLALLKGNYGLKLNETSHWIGNELNTSKQFNCNQIVPLSLYSNVYPTFIYKDYFSTEDGIYKMEKDLNATLVTDEKIIKKVRKIEASFKLIDNYVSEKDRIWKGK